MASFGRGGAGNISSSRISPDPNLTTPIIRSDVYTTGRGGQGNMAKNDPRNPWLARKSQDVEASPRRPSQGEGHYGRGGAANTIKMTPEEIARVKEENARAFQEAKKMDTRKETDEEATFGIADRGKQWLICGNQRTW